VLYLPEGTRTRQGCVIVADFVSLRHIAEVGVPGYFMITPYETVTCGDPPGSCPSTDGQRRPGTRGFKSMTPLVMNPSSTNTATVQGLGVVP